MDLLVTLCAKYRLNPSSHTLELVTANKKSTKLKPNALIGTLEAEKIILKAKGEEKNKKTGPQMPEVRPRTPHPVVNRRTQRCFFFLLKIPIFTSSPAGNRPDGDQLQ